MTFVAVAVGAMGMKRLRILKQLRICDQMAVAADAIVLHHILACPMDMNHLWLSPKRENGGVPQSVFRLEIVFVKHIVVRHMAVVAVGHFTMRTVTPGGVLRCHDVAVHAGFRFIRQVGVRFTDVKQKEKQTKEGPGGDDHDNTPSGGRVQRTDDALHGDGFFVFVDSEGNG
jgi:hypothetical protein